MTEKLRKMTAIIQLEVGELAETDENHEKYLTFLFENEFTELVRLWNQGSERKGNRYGKMKVFEISKTRKVY